MTNREILEQSDRAALATDPATGTECLVRATPSLAWEYRINDGPWQDVTGDIHPNNAGNPLKISQELLQRVVGSPPVIFVHHENSH